MAPNSSHHHPERLTGPLISPETLAGWVDDPELRIVDVRWYLGEPGRGRQAYEASHLPGAMFLDVDTDLVAETGPGRHPLPSPVDFARRLGEAGIGPRSSVVAYDDCGSWVAARLWWMLDDLGHRSVAVLDGGIDAWHAIGLPLSTDVPHFAPQPLELADRWTKVVDRETLRGQLGSVVLLDARSAERYRGETEPIDAYPGHIPTARHAPTGDVLGPDGRFLPPPYLAERLAQLGCASDRGGGVVTSCGSGVSACINALAMRIAGLSDPILYPGSYSDWTQAGYPVAIGAEAGEPSLASAGRL